MALLLIPITILPKDKANEIEYQNLKVILYGYDNPMKGPTIAPSGINKREVPKCEPVENVKISQPTIKAASVIIVGLFINRSNVIRLTRLNAGRGAGWLILHKGAISLPCIRDKPRI
jgi:hypothetical protein